MKIRPKRVNFIGIQNTHTIACDGYTQLPVRTGYEQVLAHRNDDLYAAVADKKGKVISKTEKGILVEFEDGERRGIEIGRRFGAAAGLTIPHNVVSDLKPGDVLKPGQIIAYNDGYFEKDILNPENVVYKAGLLARTVLMETPLTLEDSSTISSGLARRLQTNVTKVRTIVVSFEQTIHLLEKETNEVGSENILCIIEEAVTANNQLFDKDSLDTLRILGAQVPLAKTAGIVEKIEVLYHGDKEDMSESLRQLADESDRKLAKLNRSTGKKVFTGSVGEGFRISGTPLDLDTAAIRFYITSPAPAGVGDKGVFANQNKTVFGKVLTNDILTEDGEIVDATFSWKSVLDRIVNSPPVIGTTTSILVEIGRQAVALYKKR